MAATQTRNLKVQWMINGQPLAADDPTRATLTADFGSESGVLRPPRCARPGLSPGSPASRRHRAPPVPPGRDQCRVRTRPAREGVRRNESMLNAGEATESWTDREAESSHQQWRQGAPSRRPVPRAEGRADRSN